MDFDHSTKVLEARERLEAFMADHVLPPGGGARRLRRRPGQPLAAAADGRGAQGGGPGAGPVELVPAARVRRVERRLPQPRVRAAGRGDGPPAVVVRAVQLLGARSGQHGGAGPLRHPRAAGPLAAAAARGPHPLLLRDDRAPGGLVGRHQHRAAHRAGRRPLRAQRAQVVRQQHLPSPLRGAAGDGRLEPRWPAAPAPLDDPRAQGHARAGDRAADEGLRRLRLARRPRRAGLPRRARCPSTT